MYTNKLHPGDTFPDIEVSTLTGDRVNLKSRKNGTDWKMVLVYRGKHCPICTKFLNALEKYKDDLYDAGIDLVAVSADSEQQLQAHLEDIDINYPIAYGLSEEDMQALGVYVSEPMSENETDHNFSEPALFIINEEGALQVADVANNPFVRPDLDQLISGLQWIRDPDNNYPIRGTHK